MRFVVNKTDSLVAVGLRLTAENVSRMIPANAIVANMAASHVTITPSSSRVSVIEVGGDQKGSCLNGVSKYAPVR